MPFYDTGRVRKNPVGEADIRIITDVLEQVRPHQVYAAGDLSDPTARIGCAWRPSLPPCGSYRLRSG